MRYSSYLLILVFLLIQSCSGSKTAPSTAEAAVEETNEINLTQDQLKALGLQYGDPVKTSMSSIITVQGKIDLPPQNLISVNFSLGGYLRSTKLIPGMHVSKGEVIAIMEDQAIVQLQQDYLSAAARLDLAGLELERQKALGAASAGTSRALQQAQAEQKLQAVAVRALQEKLKLIGIDVNTLNESNISGQVSVRSTINGYVSKVNVNTGKYVQPTETMFELIDPEDIHVALTLFEKDLPYVQKGNQVSIHFMDEPGKTYAAEVILVNKGLDDDRTATAHCHFKVNPKNLLPGMFVEGELSVSSKLVDAVPDEAVVRLGNKQYIFIRKSDNVVEMKAVVTGLSKDGKTALISGNEGITAGSIVLNNAYKLMGILKNSGEE
jgi:cobalt-zinc-cadmium efflux system membrane fusion protein